MIYGDSVSNVDGVLRVFCVLYICAWKVNCATWTAKFFCALQHIHILSLDRKGL